MTDTLVTSIVLKNNVTLVDIVSSRMLGQFGEGGLGFRGVWWCAHNPLFPLPTCPCCYLALVMPPPFSPVFIIHYASCTSQP
jgi:hypothetical protein